MYERLDHLDYLALRLCLVLYCLYVYRYQASVVRFFGPDFNLI